MADDALNSLIERANGRTLVVGSKVYGEKIDRRKLYKDAIGLDQFEGEGVDIVHDLERPLSDKYGVFDHIDVCSVLEHVRRPWMMAKNIDRLMVKGSTILVSVPFVWRVHAYPSDYWRMTHEGIAVLFPNVHWQVQKYYAKGRLCKLIPRDNVEGEAMLGRSEAVAFGVKSF